MKRYPALLLAISLGFNFTAAAAVTIHVPSDFPKIQLAINAAVSGDTVLVAPGTYYENINFRGKNIVVASQYLLTNDLSFINSTIINGSAPVHSDTASCVLIISGETSSAVLQGFTLTGGKGTRWTDEHGAGIYREGGGILTALSAPTIRNNFITGNEAIDRTNVTSAGGGGIRAGDGNPTILNNMIVGNRARYGAGIVLNYTGAKIINNVVAQNFGGEDFGGGGIWVNSNGAFGKVIENNTIANNSAPTNDGGGLLVQSTSVLARNNIIWGNSALTGSQISVAPGSSLNVSYSDVQGGYVGTANINTNPFFLDTSYYLAQSSPCKDAGNPSASYNDPLDTLNIPMALFPSRGTTANDMGAFGGPGSRPAVYVDLHLNDPNAPAGFTAYSNYQTPYSIKLAWTDPVLKNDGSPLLNFKFHVYRNTTLIASVDSGVQMYIDSGLVQHTQYRYFIRTVIPSDSSSIDSAQAYSGGHRQPKAPVLTSAIDASNGTIIGWKNPSRQLDDTPLNDLAYILIYRDNVLVDSIAQGSADTAQQRTYFDSTEGYHYYKLRGKDNEAPENFSAFTDSSLCYGKIPPKYEDGFEQGYGKLYRTGSWDTTSSIASSGTHSITDSPIGNSTPGTETSIMLPPLILSSFPVLRCSDIAIVQPGSFAIIDISINHRKSFQTLRYYDWTAYTQWQDAHADPGDWINETIDLSAYVGDTATIRFRLIAGTSSPADGWYLDNIYAGPADTVTSGSFMFSPSWNMISLPLTVPNGKTNVAFPPAVTSAFAYNGIYLQRDSLEPGTGYWLKFDSSESIPMTGKFIPKDTIALKKGWNMIGTISTPVSAPGISTIPPSILRSAFYLFDSVYKPATVLQPGRAYWIKSSVDGKIILNSLVSSMVPLSKPAAPEPIPAAAQIECRDADGHHQMLSLLHDGEGSPESYELPPIPPDGVFDARFATNRSAEHCGEQVSETAVLFRSARYPLTLTWNAQDISIHAELIVNNRTIPLASTGSVKVHEEERGNFVAVRYSSSAFAEKPLTFSLSQNYPNPFNPTTEIRYNIQDAGYVSVTVYDVLGEEVATLVNENKMPGTYSISWDASAFSSGIYFCRMKAGTFTDVKKLALVR